MTPTPAAADEAAPLVTVVIPTYRRPAFLARAIDSVLGQTFEELEVVVVDDASPDDSASFVSALGDSRVRLVRHDANRGPGAARNTGAAAARGRYVAFLDDDDVWLPTKLERQVPLLEAGAPIVHTLVYVADGEGRVYEDASRRGFALFREVAAAGYPYHWLLRRSSFQINSVVVARRAFEGVGGFDEGLAAVADLDLVHRLRRRHDLHLVDEPLVKYCLHGGNSPGTAFAREWLRLAAKELAHLAESDVPHRREIEAYLYRQLAQSHYVLGSYGRAAVAAARARQLDGSVLPLRTLAKYAGGAVAPPGLVGLARRRLGSDRAQDAREPDPWLDLP